MSLIECSAHPNLALVKYWGKNDREKNLPASPSIGISLDAFSSTTQIQRLTPAGMAKGAEEFYPTPSTTGSTIHWRISIDQSAQGAERYIDFFKEAGLRYSGPDVYLDITSNNNFPTAAGLASSASGFAALAGAVNAALCLQMDASALSALARRGSGSASRSIYPGFVHLDRDAQSAVQLHEPDFWPELRCVVVQVSSAIKSVSSRAAMEDSRVTSPFYKSWIIDSITLAREAIQALAGKDLQGLGPLIRRSYLRMFSTMFSSESPLIYWEPESLSVIKTAERLRSSGIPVYETMDAGPQVKLITTEEYIPAIESELRVRHPQLGLTVSSVGGGLEMHNA